MSNNAISLRFASHWNVPVFTTGGMEETFRDKSSEYRSLSCTVHYSTVQYSTPVQYRSLTCLGGDYDQFAKFFAKLMKQFSWRHVTFVYHQVPA